MTRAGAPGVGAAPALSRRGRCSTTISPTGGRPMRCLPEMSLMSGTGRCMATWSAPISRLAGLQPRAQIVWVKQHFTLSRGHYHWRHENCWYAVRQGKVGHWQGDRKQTTVWEIANNNPFGNRQREQSWGHGTQKPVECMRRPILNNSRPGQLVYDPFLGSGTSLIGAEMTGRTCIGIEISPAYVDVILRRWQDFTGRTAIHQASGQSFNERAANQVRALSGAADA